MAVYTQVSIEEASAFLSHYPLGKLITLQGIAEGVENSNYLLTTECGKAILTLFEKRVSADDLPFFMALTRHLSKQGIPCPAPLEDDQGVTIGELAGRPACVITFLEGNWPRKVEEHHLKPLGEMLARMHLAVQDFSLSRANPLALAGWKRLHQASGARLAEIEPDLPRLVAEEMAWLEAHWPRNLPQGVIHADLFPDNVFFQDKTLSGVIDFYFACTDFFAYDLAICLNSWCFVKEPAGWVLNDDFVDLLIEGYVSVRPWEEEERRHLLTLCRGAAMRFLMTRAYDWLNVPPGALVTPHDPLDYAARLRIWREKEPL
ncbi:MAG: homoserine kinase [Alphaproteobacteria bacterium]|nr:homoserine kinase [Alphaproteobacteria bacterium]